MKHWIEVYNEGQLKPSLRDITHDTQDEIRRTIRGLDDLGIPWAFGCGERMPDQIEWIKRRDDLARVYEWEEM